MKKVTPLITLLCLAWCFSNTAQAQFTKKMVGYQTSWQDNPAGIDYANLTHLNYAFVVPHFDGSGNLAHVPDANVEKFKRVFAKAKANNVKVLLSVGGWLDDWPHPIDHADDPRWNTIINDQGKLNTFVNNLMKIVDDHNLDGIDLDWEFPSNANNWEKLVNKLSGELKRRGKLFTAAVYPLPSDHWTYNASGTPDPMKLFDFINLMTYNFPYDNIAYSDDHDGAETLNAVIYWRDTRDIPGHKIIVGFNTGVHAGLNDFRQTTSHYLFKAQQANSRNVGGIMVWSLNELGRSGIDPALIKKINSELNRFNPGKTYNIGDKVYFNGNPYVSINEITREGSGITPAESPWFWQPL